jgi:hypothetical protein
MLSELSGQDALEFAARRENEALWSPHSLSLVVKARASWLELDITRFA